MAVLDGIIKAIEAEGGRCYKVGGCVRDGLLGIKPKDIDVEVFRIGTKRLIGILSTFGEVNLVGASFGVLKLRIGNEEFDFSLPRRDSKTGEGHKGFTIRTDTGMSLKAAAGRRDFTINAISMGSNGRIHDPYGGVADLKARVLRHVSPAFVEDPLRVLRGMQIKSRYNLTAAASTVAMCRSLIDKYPTLAIERVWGEWEKWATKGVTPSRGLSFLWRTGWIAHYPALAAMVGLPQDGEWHPEGSRLTNLSSESRLARSAVSTSVDLTCSTFGEFMSFASARNAGIEAGSGAPLTKIINDEIVDSFTPAFSAGTNGIDLSVPFSQTGLTKAMSLVWQRAGTSGTNEGVRVVLEVPFSRVKAVVDSGVDDFQILWTIVKPVAIPVMNMLYPEQRTANKNHHNNAMDAGATIDTGPRCVEITARIGMDDGCSTVDCNVFFTFVIAAVGDADRFAHRNKYNTNRALLKFHNGSVWQHTKHVCDAAARIAKRDGLDAEDRLVFMFGALCHDMGKVTTTAIINGRITSHGHDVAGVAPTESFMRSIGAPERIVVKVAELTRYHMIHVNGEPTARTARRLVAKIKVAPAQLFRLIEADHSGRPPLPRGLPANAQTLQALVAEIGDTVPAFLTGQHLIDHGWQTGPFIGVVLRSVYERQLNGEIINYEGALAAAIEMGHQRNAERLGYQYVG